MSILLSDAGHWKSLLPLTFTRPVGALRPGILTIADAWMERSELPVGFLTEPYLQKKFPIVKDDIVMEVDASLLPTPEFADAVLNLEPGEALTHRGRTLAFCRPGIEPLKASDWHSLSTYWKARVFSGDLIAFTRPWHLFQFCGSALQNDYAMLTEGRQSEPLDPSNKVIGDPARIFIEAGAVVMGSILNTTRGPIYIGRDAEVMEGCLVRGPMALGDGGQLKMGTKVYGPSSFGPQCRVGGEVTNSVMMGFSNKGHDGFLGNSVLGEWCNLGAGTNNSNLKNTYGIVRAWSYEEEGMQDTGLQFCGLTMGDHSKSGINTMFNTGTVVGVCANVFGGDFPPKHIPSFSWGGSSGLDAYEFEKAVVACRRVMERRDVPFTKDDEAILKQVLDLTTQDA